MKIHNRTYPPVFFGNTRRNAKDLSMGEKMKDEGFEVVGRKR